MDVPEDVRNLGGVLAKAGAPGATLNSMIIGSSAAGGFDSSGLDGDGDEDMGSSVMGTVGGRTPKPKAVRGKGKKTLAAVPGHQVVASSSIAASAPVPRTPKGKSPSKKKAGASGVPSVGEQTPGGTAIPASFSDLLMAAGVYSQPTTTTKIGTSATRGSANADDGEDEIDELESEDDPTNLNESPKRRRVEGAAPSSWVPGQTLTSGQLPQYQQQSVAGPSVPRNPLNSSTGSEGTMHATALDLLALASFGSQDPSSSNPSSQPVASSSSSRLGGVMASSQPSLSHNGFGGEGLVSLDAPFVLRSSPDPPHGRSSPSFYPAQATPLRPQHGQYQNDDVFSPSTPGSSIPSRVKDFSMGGGGTNGGPESPFGSPSGQAAAAGGGTGGAGNFVNLSSANIQTANTANNMPARRVRSPYLKWSNEEDELLARVSPRRVCVRSLPSRNFSPLSYFVFRPQGVAKYGQKWDLVSKAVPTRSYHQCRQRWLRKLGELQSSRLSLRFLFLFFTRSHPFPLSLSSSQASLTTSLPFPRRLAMQRRSLEVTLRRRLDLCSPRHFVPSFCTFTLYSSVLHPHVSISTSVVISYAPTYIFSPLIHRLYLFPASELASNRRADLASPRSGGDCRVDLAGRDEPLKRGQTTTFDCVVLL